MSLNIGVIGAGSIGTVHLGCLKKIIDEGIFSKYGKKIRIRGVSDINEEKLNLLKQKNPFNIDMFTTNPEDLINAPDIDVIYIAVPTKFHEELYVKAAEQEKHVFCEKPLAFTTGEIENMIKIEKKNGIFTQVGLVLRHCPVFLKMKQELKENQEILGKELAFIFRDIQEWPVGSRMHPSIWRKDPALAHAGCLFEHSIHDVDLLEFLFGDSRKLSKIHALIRYISPLTKGSLEDVSIIDLEYSDGLSGNLTSIWNHARIDERRVEIYHENGYMILDGYTGFGFNDFSFLIKRKKHKLNYEKITKDYLHDKGYTLSSLGLGPYLYENMSFLESILLEKRPYPGLDIGLRAHQIIEAAYNSSKMKNIISFS
ncbi:MAG: Gfo/Idh/MocA family protein [Promethearchaeota archaeon]